MDCFAMRDGESAELTAGRRLVERHSEQRWVTKITIEAEDALGRKMHAVGSRLTGILINRHSFIDSNGLIAWEINGKSGHGEDQDMWPVHAWADFRRHTAKRGQHCALQAQR